MSSADNIPAADAMSYADGRSAIDLAVQHAKTIIQVWQMVQTRPVDIAPLPMWTDLSTEAVACKIVAALLDSQWTPPDLTAIAEAAARSRERKREYDAWIATKTPEQVALIVEYYSETGEYPPAHLPPSQQRREGQ